MSSVSTVLLDPNDVLAHPSNWVQVEIYAAYLLSAHMPVVAVYILKGRSQAVLIGRGWASERARFHLDRKGTKFYVQVGINKTTAARSPVPAPMSLSPAGTKFIEAYEAPPRKSFNATTGLYFPYDDGAGNPTIGFGHLITSNDPDFSKGIAEAQVQALFAADVSGAVAKVNKALKVGLSQNQFDALTDLAYNHGNANRPVKVLNGGAALHESDFTYTPYCTSHGVFMKGLFERREAEWVLFSQNIYDPRHGGKF